jgi:hypothetical protein
MAAGREHSLRFAPSRVEGLSSVTKVTVFPDRLELLSDGQRIAIRFLDISRWYRNGWLWRPLARLGWIRERPCVADRDWFHPPSGRFFKFYTEPPLVVYMPDEPADIGYEQTMFRRVQDVIGLGGFRTYDLG